ncbi:hypothetical protein LACWKB8_0353 [Lactobacillus sp. wkB8]|nr:hypothetical protein LACWKB8_0353 [Lactobacillus sp. wkB8]
MATGLFFSYILFAIYVKNLFKIKNNFAEKYKNINYSI